MGVTSSAKIVITDAIGCSGSLKVTLALSASPDILTNPTDIFRVLDRSGSMAGIPLTAMKEGALAFIDIISGSTDGTPQGDIGSGSRMAVISFADTATADTPLTTSGAELKSAVSALSAQGGTNHASAFQKAISMFDGSSQNAKVIVMFTDGKTTLGLPPAPVAAQARSMGAIIYCIGLTGSDGIDINALNAWASDPDASHVAVTTDPLELKALFETLAANITKTGATNIVIDEKLNPDFTITSIDLPTAGTAAMTGPGAIQWKIDKLGVSGNEGASLSFGIKHIADTSGKKKVNLSVDYSDAEGSRVIFPSPEVTVDCDIEENPDPCPRPLDFEIDSCQSFAEYDAGDIPCSGGQILRISARLKNVCPQKSTALGVILSEKDCCGGEIPRGFKAFTLKPHDGPCRRDVMIKGITFVLPEDESPSLCRVRRMRVRFIGHQIDTPVCID